MNSTNVYHLRKSELVYELKIRDVSTDGAAAELRKRLSQCLSTDMEVKDSIVNSLDPEEELEVCENTFDDLASAVVDYDGNLKDNEFNRLSSRLNHLYDRAKRIPITASLDDDMEERKDRLVERIRVQIFNFAPEWPKTPTDVSSKRDTGYVDPSTGFELPSLRRNVEPPKPLISNIIESGPNLDRGSEQRIATINTNNRTSAENSRSAEATNYHTENSSRNKSIPVYKWGIRFDSSSSQSIGAFLERVEELRRARGMTPEELFKSAVDLFSGPALTWYRSTLTRISTWEDLCREMRIVFQVPDYDFKLQHEIFNRFQGDHESIDMFIAAMEGLYSRLSCNVPEDVRLKQVMHNLSPPLQDRLALFDINTLEELRHLGRKAEGGRSRFVQRSSTHPNVLLEPDLAYNDPHRKRVIQANRVSSVRNNQPGRSSTTECWNCGTAGHRYSQCRQSRKRFCYGCGLADVIKGNCPKCTSKNLRGREPTSN